MESGELWRVGLGTVATLAVLVGLFSVKRLLRSRLLPEKEARGRGEAMTELLLLQARLEARADRGAGPEEGGAG